MADPYRMDIKTPTESFVVECLTRSGGAARITGKPVLRQQHPQIGQFVGTVIGVGNDFIRRNTFLHGIQAGMDHIVSLVGPVLRSGLTIGTAINSNRLETE